MFRSLACFAAVNCVATLSFAQPAPELPERAPDRATETAAPELAPATPPAAQTRVPEPQPAAPPRSSLPPPRLGTRMALDRSNPRPPARPRGARVHDGFFLRAATGFGAYEESIVNVDEDDPEVSGRSVGFASLGELAIGGTIAPGLVLGGGAYTTQLLTAHFKLDRDSDGELPPELDPELRTVGLFGPFLDWYPNPRKGFHLQIALGVAAMTSNSGSSRGFEDPEYQAVGGGLVLGGGYEWFIEDQWSIGVLARSMGAIVTGKDDQDTRWLHGISTTPSLLLSVTYH